MFGELYHGFFLNFEKSEIAVFLDIIEGVLFHRLGLLRFEAVVTIEVVLFGNHAGEHFVEIPSNADAGKPLVVKHDGEALIHKDMGVGAGPWQREHQNTKLKSGSQVVYDGAQGACRRRASLHPDSDVLSETG